MPITRASICLAMSFPLAHAALVGQWRGTDYTSGNWISTPATGSIAATLTGAGIPAKVTDGYVSGTGAVDFPGDAHFIVPQASNPVSGATAMSLVAIFKPFGPGASGVGFHLGSGLIGMEQNGVTNDWGFSWNGTRISGAAPGAGVVERTLFSDPLYPDGMKVAMFTWSNTGVQQIFVDGVLVSTQITGVTAPRNAGDFALGASIPGSLTPNAFNGEIAELQMYNSDESANAGTIATALKNAYAANFFLEEAAITPTGGRFVLVDTAASQVNAAGTFALLLDGAEVPPGSVQVSKSGDRTTVTFTAAITPGAISYSYDLTVPKVGGGTPANYFGNFVSQRLPIALPGLDGAVGSWGIREILTGDTPLPADANSIATAIARVLANPATVEATAPVFNHADPDTNGATDAQGNFNNDFSLLANAAGDQDFVVVGKTKITISAPGEIHTFSIHGDDGFALRVSGPGGGRFISVAGDTRSQIDPGDTQTVLADFGTGDSNTRATYRFDAAGTYDLTYLGWDGGSGGYYEVAWAPGTHLEDRDTNLWKLVGNNTAPSIPALRDRFIANPPGPVAEAGAFGVRTFLASAGVTDLNNASTFLATTTRTPQTDGANTIDAQLPFLNHRDPNNGAIYRFTDDKPFPGNNGGVDENNVVTVAKGRITIPSAGTYTFITTSDDGFMFRLKGTGGNPDPSFRRVTSPSLDPRFQMSNPNEMYLFQANIETRGIVDLAAGDYDIEYLTVENGGGFNYELGVAAGEWPHATEPPNGFQLVGVPAATLQFPAMASQWEVKTSMPFLTSVNNPGGSIATAEDRITFTQNMSTSDPRWAELGLDPANRTTFWDSINFRDPQDGPEGRFSPTNPFPLNTVQGDNDYAMKATGVINITEAGTYHLGFQGDDGGYMLIRGLGGLTTPSFTSIPYTNHPGVAVIEEEVASSGIFNKLKVETGSGDSRTLGSVDLQVGQYQIVTLVFEGGGGSWWEVIGGSATASYNYPLLSTTAGSAAINGGLTLIAQPAVDPNDPNFKISGLTITGSPVTTADFSFGSQVGVEYTVEASTTLAPGSWTTVATVTATGTTTPVSVDLTDFPALTGQSKVFFRVEFTP